MALKISIYNQKAEKVKEMDLPTSIFGLKPNNTLIHQALVTQMANERQVLAHTKDRSEVRGGGRKPWRQKGTGRARAGSSRSPIWIGGGVTFGPDKNRNFKKSINKKMKQKAIYMTLADKMANKNLLIFDKIISPEYKTKEMATMISVWQEKELISRPKKNDKKKASVKKPNILFIVDKVDKKVSYSLRNLPGVKMIALCNINILDLLKYRYTVFTLDSIEKLVRAKETKNETK